MTAKSPSDPGIRIAVEGCGHGTLNAIYTSVEKSCQEKGWDGVDLVIIGGDFEALRNVCDLNCMAVPMKYREMGDFHEYYSGARKAPYLTLFVGGNHEASNHLWELYYGGWVAPNIYYLGAANILRFGPLRISGFSGIWKGYNYNKPHFERLPYNNDDVRSIYHVRELDVRKLLQVRTQIDIGISHDWPRAIEWHGNHRALFATKNQFESESKAGTFGSLAAKRVLDHLRPAWWFSAHLHVKFSALYKHESDFKPKTEPLPNGIETTGNTDEIELDLESDTSELNNEAKQAIDTDSKDEKVESPGKPENLRSQLPASFSKQQPQETLSTQGPTQITNQTTRFLALDKCLPYRKFLQLVKIDHEAMTPGPHLLQYDKEWLAILRVFSSELQLGGAETSAIPRPRPGNEYQNLIEKEEAWVEAHLVAQDKMTVPENFEITAPVHALSINGREPPKEYTNPQTTAFCRLINIENKFDATEDERQQRRLRGPRVEKQRSKSEHSSGRGERGRSWQNGRGQGNGRGRGRGRGGAGF